MEKYPLQKHKHLKLDGKSIDIHYRDVFVVTFRKNLLSHKEQPMNQLDVDVSPPASAIYLNQ